MELNEQYQNNIEFIKNYDPQKGIDVSSGRLVTSENSVKMVGISKEVLKNIEESLSYNRDLSNKMINLLEKEDKSVSADNSQMSDTRDKVQDLLQLIDHTKKIKNGLDNLISVSEQSGRSKEGVERLKAIVNVHLEQFSNLLEKESSLLNISSNRNDAPINVAINTLIKPTVQRDLKVELQKAIHSEDDKELRQLLSAGADINMTFADGTTPLTYALSNDYKEMARVLMSLGANPNQPDSHRNFPFLLAIVQRNMPMVQSMLMDPEVNVDVQNPEGNTALHMASFAGSEPLVQGLLGRYANINTSNNEGRTAVFAASSMGHENIVRLLVQEGADLTIADSTGATPLIAGAFRGHLGSVRFILDQGIKPDEATARGGNTALHAAADEGHKEIAKALIEAGADPLKKNDKGFTPLDLAAQGSHSKVYEEMLSSIDLKSLTEDQRNSLVFSLAAGGMLDALEKLITLYPDIVNATSKNGETPLMMALSKGQRPIITLLLNKGAKASGVYDKSGQDPLIKASFTGSREIIDELLKHGADPSYRDPNGFTALEYLLESHYDSIYFVKAVFPLSAIDNAFEKYGMSKEPRSMTNLEELILKLEKAKIVNLHRRLDLPIDDSTRTSVDQLFSKLQQSRFKVDQLRQDNIQAHSKLQAARMSGSTTINTEGSNQTNSAADEWIKADDLVRSWVNNRESITPAKLCELNSILNPKNRRAEFRGSGLMTAGGNIIKSYIPYSELNREMKEFTPWLDDRLAACDAGQENPIIVAAQAYQRLVSIHPFNDGNGRTCRLVMDYVLQRYGLPPSSPSDVNVAIFALFHSDITPSTAVMSVASGLENSSKYFSV